MLNIIHNKNDRFSHIKMILIVVCSGKPGLGGLTGAQSVSFRQGSNVEFGETAHERMVSSLLASILVHIVFKRT